MLKLISIAMAAVVLCFALGTYAALEWGDVAVVETINHETGQKRLREYRLSIDRDPKGHKKIRSLMREKYGWRDRWVATLFDVSKSRMIAAHRN